MISKDFPATACRVKSGDWVTTRSWRSARGFVKRVARDGSWADVRWRMGGSEWVKRMRASALLICTDVPIGSEIRVVDETRLQELLAEFSQEAQK